MNQKALTLLVSCLAALSAAAVLGAIGLQWAGMLYRGGQSGLRGPLNAEIDASTSTLSVPVLTTTAQAQLDIPTIKQAMADCDAEAAKNPDDLYFLVTPVALPATFETAASLLQPAAVANYGSFFLIPSSQALLGGLDDGFLTLSAKPYEFSVIDVETAQITNWSSASGLSKFTQPNAAAVSKFKIGFDFGDKSVNWTNEYDRQRGTCYWVNVRFPDKSYSSWFGSTNSKSFPNPAATIRCANRVCERIDTNP